MDAYYFTARAYAELQKNLPDARFANADLLVNWVRLVKSDAEIDLMRQAGQIANRVMTTAIDRLEPGVRECDAVAAVYQAQMSGTEAFGGDYPAIVPMMPTGEKTSAPHLTWTDAPYESEQMVNLELAACRHRYHCPIARTAYLGKNPPAKLVEAGRTHRGRPQSHPGSHQTGHACRSGGTGLAHAHRQGRAGEGITHRLRHGTQLPTGLG
jgi:ectoine hydrolase